MFAKPNARSRRTENQISIEKRMDTFVDSIVADDWTGVLCSEEEIAAPSVVDLDRVIDALDAKTRTLVSLYAQDGANLTIGGGAGQYVVYLSTPDEELWNLLADDPDRKSTVILTAGGQEGDYPARQVVNKQRARQAGYAFLLTGQMDTSLPWEKQA